MVVTALLANPTDILMLALVFPKDLMYSLNHTSLWEEESTALYLGSLRNAPFDFFQCEFSDKSCSPSRAKKSDFIYRNNMTTADNVTLYMATCTHDLV